MKDESDTEKEHELVAAIRKAYSPGTRVLFLGFGEPDPTSLRVETEGIVRSVDDLGTVHVDWPGGIRLGCVVRQFPGRRPDQLRVLFR
jgi:hypothetical protein